MTEPQRFQHTSIFSTHISKIHDPTVHSIRDFCLYDHPALEAIKRNHSPLFKIILTRLEPRICVYSDKNLKNTLEQSKDVTECILAEAPLYDTRHLGQLMCIGVGRFPHNLLRPFVGDQMEPYYEHPDLFDPSSLCAQISRDHGLVFLDLDGKVGFRDFGTKKAGKRSGSKNGTWINGEEPIQDLVILWNPDDYLGLGGRILIKGKNSDDSRKEHLFKLRYEVVNDNQSWIKPISN
jgi:hypothetical protein